jgi:Coenzyme PQQ synthesis protein D (PqqD)
MSGYRIPGGVLEASLDDGRVLLNERTGMYHHLNRTGARIVQMLADGETIESVAESLARDKDESLERVRRDVQGFVAALVERGLLAATSSGGLSP